MSRTTKGTTSITRADFFEVWSSVSKSQRPSKLFNFVSQRMSFDQVYSNTKSVKDKIYLISKTIEQKWKSSGCRKERFLTKNKEWMAQGYFVFSQTSDDLNFEESREDLPCTSRAGRPLKSFELCTEVSKRVKVRDLMNSNTTAELLFAGQMAKRSDGFRIAADVIKSASESELAASQLLKARKEVQLQRSLTREEALALYIDTKLTRNSYKTLRKQAMKVGHLLYPSAYGLKKAKEDCFPNEESIFVNETHASIIVKDIVNLTTTRLLKVQEPVIADNVRNYSTLTFVCKWGGDGSSGHSTYKQKFKKQDVTDEYLFVISFVPLILRLKEDPSLVIWQNENPSSTRLCRPIKFVFAKETEELSVEVFKSIRDQIDNLNSFEVTVASKKLKIEYDFVLTMIDGKIANYLTSHKSTQSCYICGAKPSEMNEMDIVKTPNTEFYSYGLSSLHAWIKTFECLLHIAYKLDVKKWAIRDEVDKMLVATCKKRIQDQFKAEMGLIIDKPKPGFGTTNDGNTARKFCKNYEKSAEITGLDKELIKNFFIILSCISSGYEINLPLFEELLKKTKQLYLAQYSWYYMPVSVHKIICHGSDIIKSCIVPIGQLSEEAQEARNKDCRRFRLSNTRKTSRVDTNRDLLNMLLISSDPLISSYRETPLKNTRHISVDILKYLVQPNSIKNGADVRFCNADEIDDEYSSSSADSDSS